MRHQAAQTRIVTAGETAESHPQASVSLRTIAACRSRLLFCRPRTPKRLTEVLQFQGCKYPQPDTDCGIVPACASATMLLIPPVSGEVLPLEGASRHVHNRFFLCRLKRPGWMRMQAASNDRVPDARSRQGTGLRWCGSCDNQCQQRRMCRSRSNYLGRPGCELLKCAVRMTYNYAPESP